MSDPHARILTTTADVISAFAILGSFAKILPPIAALAATCWYVVQVWESHTVQKWWRLHKRKRHTIRHHKRTPRPVKSVIRLAGDAASNLRN